VSEEFLRLHWGKKFPDIAEITCRHLGGQREHIAAFLKKDEEVGFDYQFDPKLLEVFRTLRRHGHLITLLTSRDFNSLTRAAKSVDLDLKVFDHVQTTEDSSFHKPDGRVFIPMLEWARAEGCSAQNAICFGDTIKYDYAAAQDCQPPLRFVGVVSGVNTASEFLLHQVADLVYGVNRLPEYLEALLEPIEA
jgi:FMN phosphatase YigB (HAD superfamily)